jgi:hypothetical protein
LAADTLHGRKLADEISERLKKIGARAVFQASQAFDPDDRAVIVTTSNSFKGYDAEVVVIGGVERFILQGGEILANTLYVALTRARSVLAIYAFDKKGTSKDATKLLSVLEKCLDCVLDRPKVEKSSSLDDLEDVLGRIGGEHRDWLTRLWKSRWVDQEPLVTAEGEILAEPIFWFKEDDRVIACFAEDSPGTHTVHILEDAGIQIIRPGDKWTCS